MTEQEWTICIDPMPMLQLVKEKVSNRKTRLFSVSCLRRIQHLFRHEDSLRCLDIAERFAEGKAGIEELRAIEELGIWAGDDMSWRSMQDAAVAWAAAAVAHNDGFISALGAVHEVRSVFGDDDIRRYGEELAQCHLLRDIIGNPFRKSPVIECNTLLWGNETVKVLADSIYNGSLFDLMPVLADALEEAGCDNPEILAHCRGPGPHVRGCWVVDLILGKS